MRSVCCKANCKLIMVSENLEHEYKTLKGMVKHKHEKMSGT